MELKITPLHTWISARIGTPRAAFDRQALERWQFSSLLRMVAYTRQKSPFYREHFAGLGPINSFPDFFRLPFTTAENLMENPHSFVCVSQEQVHRIVSLPTSGTTAKSKRVFFSQEDQALTIDFFRTGMSTLAGAGDRVLILLPGERPGSVGDLLFTALRELGCLPTKYGPVDDERSVLQVIRQEKVNILVGAPVHLYRVACFDHVTNFLSQGQIKAVLTSTDALPVVVAERLKALWGCEIFDHYGMTETGLGGGVECSAHCGYHMREADLYIEVIDPLTGEVLPDGEEGEVVITTLTRNAMPLIRYRTGDLSHVIPGDCACGSFTKRIAPIKRRWRAGIQIGECTLFQNDLDEVMFQLNGVGDFEASVFVDEQGRDMMRLSLRIMGEKRERVQEEAREVVSRIPGMEELSCNGRLLIEVVDALNPVFAKRRIIDLRPNVQHPTQASR